MLKVCMKFCLGFFKVLLFKFPFTVQKLVLCGLVSHLLWILMLVFLRSVVLYDPDQYNKAVRFMNRTSNTFPFKTLFCAVYVLVTRKSPVLFDSFSISTRTWSHVIISFFLPSPVKRLIKSQWPQFHKYEVRCEAPEHLAAPGASPVGWSNWDLPLCDSTLNQHAEMEDHTKQSSSSWSCVCAAAPTKPLNKHTWSQNQSATALKIIASDPRHMFCHTLLGNKSDIKIIDRCVWGAINNVEHEARAYTVGLFQCVAEMHDVLQAGLIDW